MNGERGAVRVKVEVFGAARIRAGAAEVEVLVLPPADRGSLVAALADACPNLVGHGIRNDRTDLEEGYIFNRDGLAFLGEGDFTVRAGESLLLISSQAGG